MTSNTNINSNKSKAQLYKLLFYKKKDIIAIQKKLNIDPDWRKGPIKNRNQIVLIIESKQKRKNTGKFVGAVIGFGKGINRYIEITGCGWPSHSYYIIGKYTRSSFEKETFGNHLLLYLKEDISIIQNDLDIIDYSDQEISRLKEANKNARAYLQNFGWSLKRCSKCGITEI